MLSAAPIFTKETFRFFRELGVNNRKQWMDENRERYRAALVEPFRVLFERLTACALKLNPRFVVSGKVGENFSRINRDIRFAHDKSPYRTQMYLLFCEPEEDVGQIYVGLSPEAVTCGFRIYGGGKTSALATIARPRARENAKWIGRQQRRLSRKYESYWYSSEKGEWTKHKGWPARPEDWKKLQGWIVRKRMKPTAAIQSRFEKEIAKMFREVYPLVPFTSSRSWKP